MFNSVNSLINSNNSSSLNPSITVLMVINNESYRSIYCQYILTDTTANYQILEADNIADGLNLWRSHSPDVVVLDFYLRDGKGFQLLEKMGEGVTDPKLPVIMLAEDENGIDVAEALKLGSADYLIKDDINASSLSHSIHNLLNWFTVFRKLERSQQQEALVSTISMRVRQTLALDKIYEAIVQDVKKFLNADRTVIYKFNPNMSGTIVAEAVDEPWVASIRVNIIDTCFRDSLGGDYRQGRIFAANDIYKANLSPCHLQLLERFQVKANLVVPILIPDASICLGNTNHSDTPSLWGLLVVHQCSTTRNWEDIDSRLLQQLSVQLAIAIQQAELYQNLQKLNFSLEEKVRQRTAELEASERKFRAIFNNTFQLTGLLSPDGILLEINKTALDFSGLTRKQVVNRPFEDLDWWSTHEANQPCLRQAIAKASQGEAVRYEVNIRGANEKLITLDFSLRPLKNQKGAVILLIMEGNDISDRKQAEEKLRQNEELLRVSFDNAPVGMATLNLEGKFLTVNQDICKIFGYSSEQLRQMKSTMISHPDHIKSSQSSLNRLLVGEVSSVAIEKQYVHKNGQIIDAISRISLIHDINNKPLQFVVSVEDVTEKKKNEANLSATRLAEAANKAKSEFLAAMSHEIRTPMNAVIGIAGLLADTSLSTQQLQFVSIIRKGGEVLLSVINKILDFSQVESGKIELEEHPFNLRDCIDETLDLMASQTAKKSLELSALIDLDTPQCIIGDSTRLRQVLVNLIGNAIKFTESGEIVITVSSTLLESDSSIYQVNFTMRDTGIGIAPDAIDKLFKAFSQADSSITRQYGGTGLGLAISKQLCLLMGGDIKVESKIGEGTTFSFSIQVQAIATKAFAIAPELKNKQILVINSSPTIQQNIHLYAQSWGMIIQPAYSEIEALKHLAISDFDAVVIDRNLESIDALELARNIQDIFPDLPIILLTSVATEIPISPCLAGYLVKPITLSKLYQEFLNVFSIVPPQPIFPLPLHTLQLNSDFAIQHPFKILIVEDNFVNQQVLLLMLEHLGYRGDVATNGLEAVNALERQSYDLIFMDIQMPIMDGLTACKRIRQLSHRNPWIVGISANAFKESRDIALSSGMNDYLTKPLKVEDLFANLQRISHHLNSSNSLSENLDELPKKLVATGSSSQSLAPLKVQFDHINRATTLPSSDFPSIYSQVDFSTSGLTVINTSTLKMLEECIDISALSEIVSSFLTESDQAIAEMRQAFKQLDFAKISFENHAFRGGCGTLGADRLAAVCKELNYLCKLDDRPRKVEMIDIVLQQVELEYGKVSQFLQERF